MSDHLTDPAFIQDILDALHASVGLAKAHVAMVEASQVMMAACLKIPEWNHPEREAAFDRWAAAFQEQSRLIQAREDRERELRHRIERQWFGPNPPPPTTGA